MGAPKQKWTVEEEEALRKGVEKYGPGKWRSIQKDPRFGPDLTQRSNVDLKDKWRNITVANALLPPGASGEKKLIDARGEATESDTDSAGLGARRQAQLHNMILGAIRELGEDGGSSVDAIEAHIQKTNSAVPHNLRRVLVNQLKLLAEDCRVKRVKVRQKARSEAVNSRKAQRYSAAEAAKIAADAVAKAGVAMQEASGAATDADVAERAADLAEAAADLAADVRNIQSAEDLSERTNAELAAPMPARHGSGQGIEDDVASGGAMVALHLDHSSGNAAPGEEVHPDNVREDDDAARGCAELAWGPLERRGATDNEADHNDVGLLADMAVREADVEG